MPAAFAGAPGAGRRARAPRWPLMGRWRVPGGAGPARTSPVRAAAGPARPPPRWPGRPALAPAARTAGVPASRGSAEALRPPIVGPYPCAWVLPRAAWTCGSLADQVGQGGAQGAAGGAAVEALGDSAPLVDQHDDRLVWHLPARPRPPRRVVGERVGD